MPKNPGFTDSQFQYTRNIPQDTLETNTSIYWYLDEAHRSHAPPASTLNLGKTVIFLTTLPFHPKIFIPHSQVVRYEYPSKGTSLAETDIFQLC